MVKLPENLSSKTQLKSKTDFTKPKAKKVRHEFNAAPFFVSMHNELSQVLCKFANFIIHQ